MVSALGSRVDWTPVRKKRTTEGALYEMSSFHFYPFLSLESIQSMQLCRLADQHVRKAGLDWSSVYHTKHEPLYIRWA